MITEEFVEAESTTPTEEGAGAAPVEEVELEGSDDGEWGSSRSNDTLSGGLSTEETGEEVEPEKAPYQQRIDKLTVEKKSAEAREAHLKNTNDFLMQQLNKQKHVVAQTPPAQEVKEPVWEEFKEKFPDDPEKAQVEFLTARQDFKLQTAIEAQKKQDAIKAIQNSMVTTADEFSKGSYDPKVMKAFPDFHETVYHPTVVFNDPNVRHVIMSSPQKYAVAYRLAKDTALRDKLNASDPVAAGKIVGDLERLYSSPVNKRFKSKAAKAVADIGSNNRAMNPKPEDMDMDDFIKMEEAKQSSAGGW
jgi:hypothetical protein